MKILLRNFTLIFSLMVLWPQGIFSQTAENTYLNFYRQPREKLLVHVNKSVFLPGETIWFQAHLLDPRFDHPSPISANVYAGLYDVDGKLVAGNVFFADEGVATGQLSLDKSLQNKGYIFAVFTRWALNYGREHLYAQVVNIAERDYKPSSDFDIDQLVVTLNTEGHTPLIYNTLNRVVYSLTRPDGDAVSFVKGELIDSAGRIVNTFKGNETGLGEFQFWPQTGNSYSARFHLPDGSILNKNLPQITEKGLSIQVNTLTENKLNISLTNTLADDTGPYSLLIAKAGYLYKKDLTFTNSKAQLSIEKNDLPHGINTVYVLKGDEILAGRQFLNRPAEYLPEARLELVKTTKDSVYVRLNTFPEEAFTFSASVLPANTFADLDNLSFLKQNLLNPYGGVQNRRINQQLIDGNRIDNYAFDLFLQTQPLLSTSWNALYASQPPMLYDFEKGLALQGKLDISTQKAQKRKLMLFTDDLGYQQKLDINPDGSFATYHNYLEKGQLLKMALATKNNFLIKPQVEYIEISPDTRVNLSEFPFAKEFADELYRELQFNGEKMALEMSDIPDLIALQETEVSANAKDIKEKVPGYLGSAADTDRYVIDPDEVKLNFYVFDFLRTKGYWVSLNNTPGTPNIRSMRSGGGTPTIFLNNVQIVDFSILNRLPLYEVEEIYINDSGLGYGVRGGSFLSSSGGGVINIFLREGASFTGFSGSEPNQETFKVTNAFEKPQSYQAPKYRQFDVDAFRNLGVIDWKTHLRTDNKGILLFAFPRREQDKVKIRLEGMSKAGNMITVEETLPLVEN